VAAREKRYGVNLGAQRVEQRSQPISTRAKCCSVLQPVRGETTGDFPDPQMLSSRPPVEHNATVRPGARFTPPVYQPRLEQALQNSKA